VCELLIDAVRRGIPFDVTWWPEDESVSGSSCVVINGEEEGIGLSHECIEYVGGGSIFYDETPGEWVEGIKGFLARHRCTTLRKVECDGRAIAWMRRRVSGEACERGGWV
jgi:hypothetical protein